MKDKQIRPGLRLEKGTGSKAAAAMILLFLHDQRSLICSLRTRHVCPQHREPGQPRQLGRTGLLLELCWGLGLTPRLFLSQTGAGLLGETCLTSLWLLGSPGSMPGHADLIMQGTWSQGNPLAWQSHELNEFHLSGSRKSWQEDHLFGMQVTCACFTYKEAGGC